LSAVLQELGLVAPEVLNRTQPLLGINCTIQLDLYAVTVHLLQNNIIIRPHFTKQQYPYQLSFIHGHFSGTPTSCVPDP